MGWAWRFSCVLGAGLFAFVAQNACGGTVDYIETGEPGGYSGHNAPDARGDGRGGTGGSSAGETGVSGSSGDSPDARDAADARDVNRDVHPDKHVYDQGVPETHLDEYHDPGCPDVGPPPVQNDCDPLAPQPGGCAVGEACYPYVEYPSPGDPCGVEAYGAICSTPGSGTQGSPCDYEQCAAGFICVVSGQGTQCIALCSLAHPGSCPDGMVCEPIDVPGYGGCL
jgi:hypothetical protein